MRVYVSGPVTGMPGLNRRAFERAAVQLEAAGHTPLVPHWFVPSDAGWQDAMRRSIETLVKCDGVALLPGWQDSKGAVIEFSLARDLGIPVRELVCWMPTAAPTVARASSPVLALAT